jgi:nucleoside-diphosphate-sugar epimerase
MKILVTGACGLIGYELCNQLTKRGHQVWAIDDMSRGEKIPNCFFFLKQDLKDNSFIEKIKDDIDLIFHFAAINGTSNFYERPNDVISNNIRIDLNVFEYAKTCKNLKKIFYSSSSELLSHNEICLETNDIIIEDISNPRWSYKISKIASENYLHNSSLPWSIIRYFNVYGKESKKGHFVFDQIEKHKKGIYEVIGAEETRCYIHVSDAVDATVNIIDEIKEKEIINIGSTEEMTSLDAVKIIGDLMGKRPDYKLLKSLKGSAKKRKPDISKLLSYYPEYNPRRFKEGIRDILK